jgi:hypothetical protein
MGKQPPGLKPVLIQRALRGPEGPLFHVSAFVLRFFGGRQSLGPNFAEQILLLLRQRAQTRW